MSKKNYDLIATVDIDIVSPIVDDTSFDRLLIVGPSPSTTPATAPPELGTYRSLDEVIEAGWSLSAKDPVAEAAQVAFSQTPRPAMIFIAPILGTDTVTEGEGASATSVVTPMPAIERAIDSVQWYVLCTAGVADRWYETIARYIEAYDKMFVYTEKGFFTNNNVASVGGIYNRTCGIFGLTSGTTALTEAESANNYLNVAFTAKWLNYQPGSETTAFKQLSGVYPSSLTSTQISALKDITDGNLNFFLTVGNRNVTMNGKTRSGEWADVIRFRDWLKNDMQIRIVNLFIQNTKIPYTDEGISLIHNAMIASLKRGQDVGGIARDEFDENKQRIPGFATSVPLASSLTAAERASRILTGCKFKARLAGAIHFAEIKGSLTYEL